MAVVSMPPSVRLDWRSFKVPAICILGSRLYVFEDFHDYHDMFTPEDKSDGKTMWTYHLSGAESNLILEKSTMTKEPARMNHTKVFPKATVTYDGKILVFSSVIEVYHSDQSDFELYDPSTQNWHQLPNLPMCGPNDYEFDVESYSFINKSVFFLRITGVGGFMLDLASEEWFWERSYQYIPPHSGDSFVMIGKEICLVPNCAYDIGCVGRQAHGEDAFGQLCYTFPKLSSFAGPYSSQSFGITRLDNEEEEFNVCLLHLGLKDANMIPELSLQTYSTHIPTCKKEFSTNRKKKVEEHPIWWKRKRESFDLPGTSKVHSLAVVTERCCMFGLCSFSSISS